MKAFWVLPAAMVLMACNAGEPATAPTGLSTPLQSCQLRRSPLRTVSSAKRHCGAKPTKKPKPPHPISMQALINKKYDGRNLKARSAAGRLRRVQALHDHLPR